MLISLAFERHRPSSISKLRFGIVTAVDVCSRGVFMVKWKRQLLNIDKLPCEIISSVSVIRQLLNIDKLCVKSFRLFQSFKDVCLNVFSIFQKCPFSEMAADFPLLDSSERMCAQFVICKAICIGSCSSGIQYFKLAFCPWRYAIMLAWMNFFLFLACYMAS